MEHSHTFGQDQKRQSETRTAWVIVLTATTMVLEIGAGVVFGSMALLADGLHMGSHAAALGITYFAYRFARKHAHNPRFTFGTGKVNSLAGFAGAILLLLFALSMGWQSIERLFNPVAIQYNQAILVAVIGLLVNGVSIFMLGEHHHDMESHDHQHAHEHSHHHHDHNLRSAYLHVLADALTSLLAIFALLAAKYFGWVWMDPVMGLVGTLLVSRWSIGLLKQSGAVLVDYQPDDSVEASLKATIESLPAHKVLDLHVWQVAPGHQAAIVSLRAENPLLTSEYHRLLCEKVSISHLSVEVIQST